MPDYHIDFDQVAEAGRVSRHRPTFPAGQLAYATDPGAQSCALVKQHVRFHHGAWYLPLYAAHVRTWLKQVRFTQPPVVAVGGVEVTCSQAVEPPDPAQVAHWAQHYASGYFTPAALQEQLIELEENRRQFAYGKEHEREPRRAALRQLLGKEAPA